MEEGVGVFFAGVVEVEEEDADEPDGEGGEEKGHCLEKALFDLIVILSVEPLIVFHEGVVEREDVANDNDGLDEYEG